MRKFYYIAIKDGKTCEGIWRSESIDSAKLELVEKGMEEINLALLRSDAVNFIEIDDLPQESASV
jgi:hypothetical protein